jgi:hypothetical protein
MGENSIDTYNTILGDRMANSIHSLMVPDPDPIYYNEGLRVVMETHLDYFRTHPTTSVLDVAPVEASKYKGDLFGLYTEMKIPPSLHWIVMRTNNYTSPNATDDLIRYVLIPAKSELDRIRQLYQTVHQIN